jgi:hypothetical protein
MTHDVEVATKELCQELWSVQGVRDVHVSETTPHFLLARVSLLHGAPDAVRHQVFDRVNAFHRQHVGSLSVDAEIEDSITD